jgi:hypothetical protein
MLVFISRKAASELRPHTEYREHRGARMRDSDFFGMPLSTDDARAVIPDRQIVETMFESRAVAKSGNVNRFCPIAPRGSDASSARLRLRDGDQPFGVGERERAKEHDVGDREDRRRGTTPRASVATVTTANTGRRRRTRNTNCTSCRSASNTETPDAMRRSSGGVRDISEFSHRAAARLAWRQRLVFVVQLMRALEIEMMFDLALQITTYASDERTRGAIAKRVDERHERRGDW